MLPMRVLTVGQIPSCIAAVEGGSANYFRYNSCTNCPPTFPEGKSLSWNIKQSNYAFIIFRALNIKELIYRQVGFQENPYPREKKGKNESHNLVGKPITRNIYK